MHQLTPQQFKDIALTFQTVFGQAYLFRNNFQSASLPLALVGFKNAQLDWNVVRQRCREECRHGLVRDPIVRHTDGLAMLYLGQYPANQDSEAMINTLANLRTEISASRQIVIGNPDLYFSGAGENWLGFIQQQLSEMEHDTAFPLDLRLLPRLGFSLFKSELAAQVNNPEAKSMRRSVESQIPPAISSDAQADWTLWPSHEIPFNVATTNNAAGGAAEEHK